MVGIHSYSLRNSRLIKQFIMFDIPSVYLLLCFCTLNTVLSHHFTYAQSLRFPHYFILQTLLYPGKYSQIRGNVYFLLFSSIRFLQFLFNMVQYLYVRFMTEISLIALQLSVTKQKLHVFKELKCEFSIIQSHLRKHISNTILHILIVQIANLWPELPMKSTFGIEILI